jgi:iron complex transport system substrate-binding protein
MSAPMQKFLRRERASGRLLMAACFAGIVALLMLRGPAFAAEEQQRVLSIGGAVTEIVFALGEEDRLVGRDTTSSYPPEAEDLPDVGYMRALAPEGVLSIRPDLILAREGSGPPEAIEVLKAASVEFVEVPDSFSAEGIGEAIRVVAETLDATEKGDALRAAIASEFERLAAMTSSIDRRKRVLFILSTQGGRILASGTGTAADGILKLAGADNAITQFEGYKQLTDEAIISANPDVILMMDRGGNHGGDDDAVFSQPGLKPTEAAKNRAIIRMDGLYLLGFGPRTANAALDLAEALYGDELH